MKIQCSCGMKYAFDVSPEMLRKPVRFVCQSCGQDSSDFVNQLIRQELGAAGASALAAATPALTPATPAAPAISVSVPSPVRVPAISVKPPTPAAAPSPPSPPSAPVAPVALPSGGAGPLRVALSGAASTAAPVTATATTSPGASSAVAASAASRCSRHPTQESTHACLVCHKPMCPQCMQVTGLVCSPFCRSKADAQGIDVPEYALQRDVAQRRQWRKVALVAGGIGTVIAAALGFWFWYAWFGSVPKVAYAHRFPNAATHGQLHLGPDHQLIVLHAGTLARHDLNAHKIVWSVELFDRNKVAADSAAELQARIKAREQAIKNGADGTTLTIPNLETITRGNMEEAESVYSLHASAGNIWVSMPQKIVRYAWSDGKTEKEIALEEPDHDPTRLGTELLFVSRDFSGTERLQRVDLVSGESKTEGPPKPEIAATGKKRPGASRTNAVASAAGGGAGAATNKNSKALNPAAVASRVQNLPMPNRAALPATIAAAENQRRLQAMMTEDDDRPTMPRPPGRKSPPPENIERIRTAGGVIEFGTRLLEEKIVVREAMKAKPKVSALEGTVNAAATVDIANELLNEMQRDRFGSTVEEDESRYQVTVRRASASTIPWTGEVIGAASLIPLKTVDVIAAAKSLVVLDHNNKKLWEAKLNFPVAGAGRPSESLGDDSEDADGLSTGQGPCVERGDTLYVFDQGVLTSFDLANGNVRWRLPSVGTSGLWFDDRGMLYVNTTTATPDSIKYSKQIDISQKVRSLVLKVDPQTGRTIWGTQNEGLITYISGKFIYTVESSGGTGDDDELNGALGMRTGLEIPAHIRLERLDAGNGRVLWEHYQKRLPLDVHFDGNTIQLLFKKEFQHLRFIVL